MDREKKFTPGPWWCSMSQEILKMPEQIKISNFISGSTIKESKANANLIAAAPELLEALEGLLYSHEKLLAAKGMPRRKSIEAANSAIKKAHGEK